MKQRSQFGANLVEAALVLPLLLLLIFGIIELGRVYQIYQTMTNAAREGTRSSVAPPPGAASALIPAGQVKTSICNYLNAGGIACSGTGMVATVSVCQNCPDGPANNECSATCNTNYHDTFFNSTISYTQVDITVPYSFVFVPLGTTVNLKTQVVMRNENN